VSPCRIVAYPDIQTLVAPPGSSGKFVQFRWRGVEYLLFATRDQHRFHNQMLARFLEQHGLPHRWSDDETLEINTDELQVTGGGRFHIEPGHQQLELSDNSQAYGRFDETDIEEKIRTAESLLSRYSITVKD